MKLEKLNNSIFKDRYLKEMLLEFWYTPADALLRASESAIWHKVKIIHPVLNIGIGDGKFDKYFFRGKILDVSIDNDPEGIERAKDLGLWSIFPKLLPADAIKLPFESNKFAMVISNSTFEHIKNDRKALGEVARVLKPGGQFIFTTNSDRLRTGLENLGIRGDKFEEYNQRVSHYHYRNIKDWTKILNTSGFIVEGYKYYFPEENLKLWWNLFKIAIFKPYKRELWSYLKDSPVGKIFPGRLISEMFYNILKDKYRNSFSENGVLLLIKTVKK